MHKNKTQPLTPLTENKNTNMHSPTPQHTTTQPATLRIKYHPKCLAEQAIQSAQGEKQIEKELYIPKPPEPKESITRRAHQ